MNLRLFCALPVPANVQEELSAATDSLRGILSPASISWVKRGNFHLTLRFLGDVEQNRVDELASQLEMACRGTQPFELSCQGLGCFPNLRRARVIWAGLQEDGEGLAQLQNRVDAACASFLQQEGKSNFSGHITLGRIRAIKGPAQQRLADEIEGNREASFGRWIVEEVGLISSDLSHGTPHYSVLHQISLPPIRFENLTHVT